MTAAAPEGLAAACTNDRGVHKAGWTKKADARRAAKRTQSSGGGAIDVYRGDCGLWHIGHHYGRHAQFRGR